MAFTQAQLDALEAAIATGSLVVQYEDRRQRFRGLDEMLRIRDIMRRALGLTPAGPLRTVSQHRKALGEGASS